MKPSAKSTLLRPAPRVELFTNETEVQVNVLDRVPRPVLTALASLGVTDSDRLRGIPGQPQFVLSGEPILDRSAWWNAPSAARRANGPWIFMRASGLFATKLAERFAQVTAVESGASAFAIWSTTSEQARRQSNCRRLPRRALRNARFHSGRSAARRLGQTGGPRTRADSRAAPDHRLLRSGHAGARLTGLNGRALPHRQSHSGGSFPANISPRNCRGTFRISSSARLSAIAIASSAGHSRNVDDCERPPESNTCLGAGLNRPPVYCATERSRN